MFDISLMLRRFTLDSSILVALVGLLTCGTCFGVATQSALPTLPSLEATTWELTDSDKQVYIFDFMYRHKLRYVSANGTSGRGEWKQTGEAVSFEINGHTVEYKGTLDGEEMKGNAKNKRGSLSTWSAFKQQVRVVTPNAPRYPPIAASAHVTGAVRIEATVDAMGNVISASALDGHPLLRKACEASAKNWRFEPSAASPRKVHLIFSFGILPADCKNDVTAIAPAYPSPYLATVRRRQQCPTY